MDTCFEPISLGPACSPKFQICRSLFLRTHPQGSVQRLREALLSGRASGIFPRHLFDSQITPIAALIAYLEQDFEGVFERADLVVDDQGVVVHRRLGSQHPHEFQAINGAMDEAAIDAQYPAARAKFEHLAAKFQRHLQQPGPFLYVRCDTPSPEHVQRLMALLSKHGAHHRFEILFADTMATANLTQVDGRISQGLITATNDKPQSIRWEGNDASWDNLLRAFDLKLSQGPKFTANFNLIEDFSGVLAHPVILTWKGMPTFSALGDLPLTIEIGGPAWQYAALSSPVDGYAKDGARTLIVTLEVLQGDVGVVLTRSDGTGLIGKEYWVSPEDGLMQVPLSITPGMGSANILLRNYGNAGLTGSARLDGIHLSE